MLSNRSLVWKLILPVCLTFLALVAAAFIYIPQALKEHAITEAQHNAEETAARFKALRGYYTDHVLSKVLSETDLSADTEHKQHPNVIPLPATMIHELSEIQPNEHSKVRLYSPYPFPNRQNRSLDTFENKAWNYLVDQPDKSYKQVSANSQGQTVVRIAIADTLASETCVNCHNSHPRSPKKDWSLGDVRGVLEITNIIDDSIVAGQLLAWKISLFICLAIVFVVFLILIIHRQLIQKPISALVQVIEQSGQHPDLPELEKAYRLHTRSRNDEISYLFRAFQEQQTQLLIHQEEINEYQQRLENRVVENTKELSETKQQLSDALRDLIQTEKLETLGRMVSSIGHEISTPLGVANTASTFLADGTDNIRNSLKKNELKQSDLEMYLDDNEEAAQLLQKNLDRTQELIQAFKQVAVDQISEQPRTIHLKHYIDEILLSLKPSYKNTPVKIGNATELGIELTLEAGALAQIITNLITNSIIHGFDEGKQEGEILINAHLNEDSVTLTYQDNGKGISPEDIPHVFEQFFTTRKEQGGSGIGMYLIKELVHEKLGGELHLDSTPGQGIHVEIQLPFKV